MRWWVLAGVVVIATARPAHADGDNYLMGPVVGLVLSPKFGMSIGAEGGAGLGPERINLGFDRRIDKNFYYLELDPWLYLGGTLGVGVDEDQKWFPVLGVWEGIPLTNSNCASGWHTTYTLAVGYRYTGAHELYATVKAGVINGSLCID